MSKGLEALEGVKKQQCNRCIAICENCEITIIEKELKALEIIRNYGYFDEEGDLILHLPTNRKEEYDYLLKEVLS